MTTEIYQDGDYPTVPGNGGPFTRVPLWGRSALASARCGSASFVPILTLIVFMADVVLTIFAGLDLVDAGLNRPWLQFTFSLSLAFLYTALFVTTLAMHRWERILRYRYHWCLTLIVAALLTWVNFSVWASWLGRYSSLANGVSSTDGNAFITWVAVNGLGVAGFLMRFTMFAVGQGLRHTYDRSVEVQSIVLAQTTGGKNLASLVGANIGRRIRPHPLSTSMIPPPPTQSRRRTPTRTDRFARQFAGTQWAQRHAHSTDQV